ncbi:MAG: NAD(P)/FAD-dependent oxidoreductase [Patescibacteria group bacterium]
MRRVGIIGGGAAGMIAAASIVEQSGGPDTEVILFEKNKYLGAKVIISGGGRCNVTTGISDVRELIANYPRGGKDLMTAMYHFPPPSVMEWFENHGVPLKTEEDMRVFPKSDNGKDVVGALEKVLRDGKVEILLDTPITDVRKNGSGFVICDKSGKELEVDVLILTTGGNAYNHTGSTGDGYTFAKNLGHTITPLGPSLNSFVTSTKYNLAGLSFEKVAMVLTSADGKRRFERTGPFVFTHHGVSGPAIFALSSYAAFERIDKDHTLTLEINLFPEKNHEAMRKSLDELIEKNSRKTVINFLDVLLPHSLCPVVVDMIKIQADTQTAQLNKSARESILHALQHFTLAVVGRAAGDEFVTAGGVPLHEVDMTTMESKLCTNLYFAGEILDVDGFTGGFNLQASWATGRLAGENCS